MLLILHYLPDFLEGTATAMEVTTAALVNTVTGGVQRRKIPTMLGTATWAAAVVVLTATTIVRGVGCLLGASKTNFNYNL